MQTYQQERFESIAQETQALAAAHWDETEAPMYGAQQYCLDKEHYRNLENAGVLHLFTVREAGNLVGYASFFASFNTHLDGMCAMLDALFVDKQHRGMTGIKLLRFAQDALISCGAVAVQYASPASRDCGAIYRRLGAKATETIYTRMR